MSASWREQRSFIVEIHLFQIFWLSINENGCVVINLKVRSVGQRFFFVLIIFLKAPKSTKWAYFPPCFWKNKILIWQQFCTFLTILFIYKKFYLLIYLFFFSISFFEKGCLLHITKHICFLGLISELKYVVNICHKLIQTTLNHWGSTE